MGLRAKWVPQEFHQGGKGEPVGWGSGLSVSDWRVGGVYDASASGRRPGRGPGGGAADTDERPREDDALIAGTTHEDSPNFK